MTKTKSILAGTILSGALALQGSPSSAQNGAIAETTSSESIRPFKVHVSDAELADLRKRVLATRWPKRETVTDESQGVELATMQKLAHYWATEYNWRKVEAKLNAW